MQHELPRSSGAQEPARLGTLESRVMDLLWAGGSLTVREIIDQLPGNPAYTTIATVLANLRKKGLVQTRKEGHSTRYEASLRREEHTAQVIEHALASSGDREASILHFVSSIPESDLKLLRDFLDSSSAGNSS